MSQWLTTWLDRRVENGLRVTGQPLMTHCNASFNVCQYCHLMRMLPKVMAF